MENGREFVDFYALLKVDPSCDAKMLEKAYRHFAQLYHPDHPETADVEMFQALNEAYRILRDPEKRDEYDQQHRIHRPAAYKAEAKPEDASIDQRGALDDAEAHEKMLAFLYKRRREHAEDPGVIRYFVQQHLDCSDESFDFHVWYLKSKGYVDVTEHGTLAITVEGVDHVIGMSRSAEEARILQISQSRQEN